MNNKKELDDFGVRLGRHFDGGETIELVGDVGAGKTTLTKAIASGMGIADDISSPSYTLSQTYESPSGVRLVHYDFYRLSDPGVLANELKEVLKDMKSVVVIEWAAIVKDVLPDDHLTILITPVSDMARNLSLRANGPGSLKLLEALT